MGAQLCLGWIRLCQSPVTCGWDFGPLGPDSRAGEGVPELAKAQVTGAGLCYLWPPCTCLLPGGQAAMGKHCRGHQPGRVRGLAPVPCSQLDSATTTPPALWGTWVPTKAHLFCASAGEALSVGRPLLPPLHTGCWALGREEAAHTKNVDQRGAAAAGAPGGHADPSPGPSVPRHLLLGTPGANTGPPAPVTCARNVHRDTGWGHLCRPPAAGGLSCAGCQPKA